MNINNININNYYYILDGSIGRIIFFKIKIKKHSCVLGTTFRLFFMQLHLTVCPFFLFYACTNVKHELHVPTLYHYHDVVVEFYDYDHPPPLHPQCHRHYQLLCFSF